MFLNFAVTILASKLRSTGVLMPNLDLFYFANTFSSNFDNLENFEKN